MKKSGGGREGIKAAQLFALICSVHMLHQVFPHGPVLLGLEGLGCPSPLTSPLLTAKGGQEDGTFGLIPHARSALSRHC